MDDRALPIDAVGHLTYDDAGGLETISFWARRKDGEPDVCVVMFDLVNDKAHWYLDFVTAQLREMLADSAACRDAMRVEHDGEVERERREREYHKADERNRSVAEGMHEGGKRHEE